MPKKLENALKLRFTLSKLGLEIESRASSGKIGHFSDHRGEVSWTPKLQVHQSMVVQVENTIDTSSGTVVPVSRTWEEMALILREAWESNLGSEPINWHRLVPIVVEQNVADRCDGLLVLIRLRRVHVVKGAWISRVTI
jgi:hypothetical protein